MHLIGHEHLGKLTLMKHKNTVENLQTCANGSQSCTAHWLVNVQYKWHAH